MNKFNFFNLDFTLIFIFDSNIEFDQNFLFKFFLIYIFYFK